MQWTQDANLTMGPDALIPPAGFAAGRGDSDVLNGNRIEPLQLVWLWCIACLGLYVA